MTEQTELSDDMKAELAAREAEARTWTRIQADETKKAATEHRWKNIAKMSEAEYRNFVLEQCGF